MQRRDLVIGDRRRHAKRRQLRRVQDLVGVRVADAVEQRRIGQRALDRVPLAAQPLGELRAVVASNTSRPPRSNSASASRPCNDVHRRALLRRRLGEDQRAVREVERREPDLARDLLAALLPAQPPRDHQVDHDEALALDADHDALAHALDGLDLRAVELARRRRHRAQHERARDPHRLEQAGPTVSAARRSTYTVTSGSSGTRQL